MFQFLAKYAFSWRFITFKIKFGVSQLKGDEEVILYGREKNITLQSRLLFDNKKLK